MRALSHRTRYVTRHIPYFGHLQPNATAVSPSSDKMCRMQRSTAIFSLPPWVQITIAIVGGVGFLLTLAGLILAVRWSPRRANEHPRRGRPLRTIRFWRPSHYSLALGYLEDYCQRLINHDYHVGSERGYVTESDLVRWTFQLALTCAAYMVPHSLGKANLFRVSAIISDEESRRTEVRVYSSEFVGVYPARQLTDPFDNTRLRNLRLAPNHQTSGQYPAALQCVGDGLPIRQSLKNRKAAFDEPEKALGATHILAIPLVRDLSVLKRPDQPTSITVDLHFGRIMAWLIDHRDFQKTTMFRRASKLSQVLTPVEQLSAPMLLVTAGLPPALQTDDDGFSGTPVDGSK